MAKSMNRVTLLGNLGRDPEIRATPNGNQVCTLNLATTESYKDKSGNWQETTDWHRVIFWDKTAETCQKFLSKGSKVMIEGKLKTRSYEDKESGKTVYITEVIGRDLYLIDSNNNASQMTDSETNYDQTPPENDDVPF